MATAIIDVVTTLGNTLGPAGYRRVTTASGGPFDLTRVSTSLGGSVSRAGAVSATAVFLWTKRGDGGGGAVTGVRLVGDGASPGEASDEFGVGVGSERLVFGRGAGRAVSELVGELEAGDGSDGRERVRLGSGAALRVARVGAAAADAPGAAPRAAAASGAGPAAREAAELENELVRRELSAARSDDEAWWEGRFEPALEKLLEGQDVVAVTNSMSTQLSGEDEAVFAAIQHALRASHAQFGRQVLVAKFIPEHFADIGPVD